MDLTREGILQINATVIAGLLIMFTLSTIVESYTEKENAITALLNPKLIAPLLILPFAISAYRSLKNIENSEQAELNLSKSIKIMKHGFLALALILFVIFFIQYGNTIFSVINNHI